jgi:hypothetical protein
LRPSWVQLGMCTFALVGAEVDAAELRRFLSGADGDLNTDLAPNATRVRSFPATDTVLCVTARGCSCALLEGVSRARNREIHVAGPSYVFRRALAGATLRFGGIRLLAFDNSVVVPIEPLRRRTVTLGQFLRSGLAANDELLCIIA